MPNWNDSLQLNLSNESFSHKFSSGAAGCGCGHSKKPKRSHPGRASVRPKTENRIMKLYPEGINNITNSNGKFAIVLHRHHDGTLSYRDPKGRWSRRVTEVPASIIRGLDRQTRVELWRRDFQIERSWAEANA
jgi:hypothetical protein